MVYSVHHHRFEFVVYFVVPMPQIGNAFQIDHTVLIDFVDSCLVFRSFDYVVFRSFAGYGFVVSIVSCFCSVLMPLGSVVAVPLLDLIDFEQCMLVGFELADHVSITN